MPNKSLRAWRSPSLALSLAVYLSLASILPLLVLDLVSDYYSRSVIEQDVTHYNQALVNAQRDYLDVLFQEIESLIINISGVDDIKNAIDDVSKSPNIFTELATKSRIGYILSGYSGAKGLVSIDIFTPGGAHYHVGDTLNVEGTNQAVLDKVTEQAQASESLVTWVGVEDNVNSNSTHAKVITAARLFQTVDARTLQEKQGALLLVNYSVDSIYEHFSSLQIGSGAYFIIIDSAGRLIYHPDRNYIGVSVMPAFIGKLTDDSVVTDVNGMKMLVTHTKSDVNGWLIVSLIPYKNLTASADTIRNVTLVVLVMSLAFIGLIVMIVSRTIIRPLAQITEYFQQIQNETFNWHIRLDEHRTDEVGKLMRWFNEFLNSMEAKNRTEQELVKAKEAAEAANRAKSIFLANMSHELRTPLNAILGFSELMSYDKTLTPSQRENVEIINRSGEHLLGLINDILDLSKIESGRADVRAHTFDLHNMVKGLGEMFAIRARQKGLKLMVEYAPNVPQFITSDDGKLRQVLINLMGNAIKFTSTGGVALRIYLVEDAPHPEDSIFRRCRLRFLVEDTGIGIKSENLTHIFEPFVQIRDSNLSQQGTGLGLTISHQHVELLGGTLMVNSQPGVGSTFSFEILVLSSAPHDLSTAPEMDVHLAPGQVAADGRSFRVLIAEDGDANRLFLAKMLTSFGFDVREAVNGEETLVIAGEWQPHLIFMDMFMPLLDGLETTKRIKATPQGEKTIIIMLTAHAFNDARDAVLTQGCDDFLRKPVRQGQIAGILKKHLGVQFVSETEPTDRAGQEKSTAERLLPAPPNEWKQSLLRAVLEADVLKMQTLIKEIEDAYPDLSKTLAEMLYHFDYDGICALIDSL